MKIKSRWTDRIIFEADVHSLRLCVEAAALARVSLHGADLRGADLRGADLNGCCGSFILAVPRDSELSPPA